MVIVVRKMKDIATVRFAATAGGDFESQAATAGGDFESKAATEELSCALLHF